MQGETNLKEVLRKMKISCDDEAYGFATLPTPLPWESGMLGSFQEKEGWTLIASTTYLNTKEIAFEGPFAKLTIEVHTSLSLVGLTAALATALAHQKIPANVISGYYHDHIFVPYDLREQAHNALKILF